MPDLCIGLLSCLILIGMGAFAAHKILADDYARKRKSLDRRELAAEQKAKEADALKQKLEAWHAAETERLQQLARDQNDEHDRKLAAVRAAEAMLYRGEPTDTSHVGVSEYLRQTYRQGAFIGEHIRVIYLLSTDGFITLRWEVDWPVTEDPMVRVSRDRKVIRTDWGRTGEHKEHVQPGGRYVYKFSVHDPRVPNRVVGKRLLAEVVVPAAAVWDAKPPGSGLSTKRTRPGQRERTLLEEKVGAFVAAERAAAKLRQEVEKVLRKQGLVEDELEHRMSRLDARIAEIRDEIGA